MPEQKFLTNLDVAGTVDLSNLTIDSAQGADGQVLTSTGVGVAWENAAGGASETAERIEVTVKNVSGGSLSKGTVVHASPSANPPNGNVIEVIAADYDDSTKMPAIGILNETIANEGEGSAVMMGAVSGIDTSSFSISDELYVGNLGTLTNTKPAAAGQLIQKIAVVIKSHASNGLIKIFGAGRSNDVPLPLYIDNTNQRVGIGTSSPDFKTHLYDSGNTVLGITAGIANFASLQFGSTSDTTRGAIEYYTGDDSLRLKTGNNTERMRISSEGNVGIGESSPTAVSSGATTLTLKGSVTTKAGALLLRSSDNSISSYIYPDSVNGLTIGSLSNHNVRFISNSAERMRITSGGNVGIGESDPSGYWGQAFNLVLNDSNTGLTIKSTTTGNGRVVFTDTKSSTSGLSDGGMIHYDHSSDSMRLHANGSERMRINSSGQVYFKSSTDYKIGLNDSSGTIQWWLKAYTSGNFGIHEDGVGDQVTIKAGGNVGIGTTNPTEALMVEGWIRVANNTGIKFNTSASSGDPTLNVDSSAHWNFLNTAGNNLLKIDNGGDVGIGTTSPSHKLHVHSGTDNDYVARFEGSTNNSAGVWTGIGIGGEGNNTKSALIFEDIGESYSRGKLHLAVNNSLDQTNATKADAKLTVSNNGNVGIGTTSPESRLHVDGGVALINVSDDWQQSTLGTNLIRGGNFDAAINEESTSIKVFPVGTDRAVGDYWGGIGFMHLDPENSGWGTSYEGEQFWIGGRVIDQPAQERSALVFATNNATTAGTHSSEKMVILPNGNVGIGASSPGYKLEVNGTAKADEFVSLVNASNSGITRDWTIIGTGDRGAGLQVNDINGAKYAIYAGGYDLTFGKHVSSNNTYTTAMGIYAANAADSSPYVEAAHSLRAPIFYDSNNTSYYVDPTSTSNLEKLQVDGLFGSSVHRITNPGGATYLTTTSNVTGGLLIQLPTARRRSNTMMQMTINVYQYNSGRSFRLRVGGYNYNNANSWLNVFAYLIGDQNFPQPLNVRFGDDGTRNWIMIGETNTVWAYPQFQVTDFQAGYSGVSESWSDGWATSVVTSIPAGHDETRVASSALTSNNASNWSTALYAPTYYDSNNTSYYVDPASTSVVNTITASDALSAFHIGIRNTSSTTKDGIALYGGATGGEPTYGIMFTGTSGSGTHGGVTSDWATYFTMSNNNNRGWIFRRVGSGNSASISAGGVGTFDTSVNSPIFYDSNDTTYYVDPNSTSRSARLRGEIYIGPNTSSKYLRLGGNGGATDASTISTSNGNLHIDATTGYNLYLAWYNTSDVVIGGQVQATKYIDRNNTAYYVDPAGTTNIQHLIVNTYGSGISRQLTIKEDADTENSMGQYPGAWTSALNIQSNDNSTYLWLSPLTSNIPRVQTNYGQLDFYTGNNTNRALHLSGTTARSAVFYDIDNTAYYVDPASTSVFDRIVTGITSTSNGGTALRVEDTIGSQTTRLAEFKCNQPSQIQYGAVGTTFHNISYGGGAVEFRKSSAVAPDGNAVTFRIGTTSIGSISMSGSATSYNTTSDYRLKENIIDLSGGIERVRQLQPRRFNFIEDPDNTVDGFIAHEADLIVPESVTGEKDEVYPTGEPVYQAMDNAKLVPVLTAALKEAITKIEDLEARIQILENQ